MLEALRRSSERGIGDPLPPSLLERHRFIDRARAWRQIHDPQSMADVAEARRRLVFDELLRVQLALVLRKRGPRGRDQRHRARSTRRPRRATARAAAVLAHECATQGDRRDRDRHGGAASDAPIAAGRCRRGQDIGGPQCVVDRGRRWPPGCVDGADRGAGRAALPRTARTRIRLDRARRQHADGRSSGAHRIADQPHHRQRAQAIARRPRGRHGRHRGRHARADPRRCELCVARVGGHRRATSFRRRAARRVAREERQRSHPRRVS